MGAKSEHSILSPSGAGCWLKCTRCVRLCENIESEESTYAAEGTTAHELAALYLTNAAKKEFTKLKRSKWYNEEMEQYVKIYVDYVQSYINENTVDATELKVDLSFMYPNDGNPTKELRSGTLDKYVLNILDGTLHVFDLKYGIGVKVSATDNPQLKIYALGVLSMLSAIYEIKNIVLHIVQPRVNDTPSFWGISTPDLIKWKDETLLPAAKLAYKGKGDFVVGEHCTKYFCDARNTCKARHDFCLGVGANVDFAEPELINEADFASILELIPIVERWCKDVNAYALKRLMLGGKIEGFKLIRATAKRVLANPGAIASILEINGYTDIYREPDPVPLKTLGDLEKIVGKKKLTELCGSHIIRPEGKLQVVPVDAKGDEYLNIEQTFGQFKQ